MTAGDCAEVRLSDLQRLDAAEVDLLALRAARLIPQGALTAKVILAGKIERAVSLKGIAATKGARAAIEAAGGSVA
jgi:large subunit ribosomal protein L15